MNLPLAFNKDNFENVAKSQGHDQTGKSHVAYQSIRIASLNTSIRRIHRSLMSLSKVIAEKLLVTCHDLII